MKNVLLYIALFFLIVLLFIPPIFRLTMKDRYKKDEKSKDLYGMLNCEKSEESINESYFNYKAYNFKYSYKNKEEIMITSNENNEIEQENIESNQLTNNNPIVNDIYDYSTVYFNNDSKWHEYTIEINNFKEIPEKLVKYTKPIDEQKYYYESLGFTCNKTEY